MKRRRSGTVYTCEYVGCNKVLGSKRQLDAHEKTHVAAHPFTCPECSQRFSLKSELESHQTIHQPATQEMELPADASQIVEMAECDEDDIDDELKKEAAELVENAVYLASQLKIARSPKLGTWIDVDFDNAYEWTLWVEEEIESFPELDYLQKKLAENKISLEAMRSCERAFFDSILAYEKFSSKILQTLLTSIMKRKNVDEHLEKLSNSLVSAIDRKRSLEALAKVSEMLNIATNTPPRDEALVAKARLLLRQHRKWPSQKIREHLGEINKGSVLELICHEAIQAFDQNEECVTVLMDFLTTSFKEKKWENVQQRVLEDVCERNLAFLDGYLCYLISEGLRERIAGLASRKSRVGYVTREVVTEFVNLTGKRELICWDPES